MTATPPLLSTLARRIATSCFWSGGGGDCLVEDLVVGVNEKALLWGEGRRCWTS